MQVLFPVSFISSSGSQILGTQIVRINEGGDKLVISTTKSNFSLSHLPVLVIDTPISFPLPLPPPPPRTQSLLIALVSLFCTTYFPPCTKGENHVWKSTLALAALRRSHCCCFGHHVAELGQCEQRKRPMHAKWKNKDEKTLYWTTLPIS